MASSYHYRKFAQLMEKNKKNVSSQKKRRTFAEIERAQIQVGYCAYLKFKGYKPNVSNFASFIKELFRLKIRHEIFTGAP
ncbi:MAG: hypothetical protein ACD_9C00297G0001 [uncultured bacterium]|nr:MAG: hypothetical protein ACD_9C00297G0001 [uncultured bacterium]